MRKSSAAARLDILAPIALVSYEGGSQTSDALWNGANVRDAFCARCATDAARIGTRHRNNHWHHLPAARKPRRFIQLPYDGSNRRANAVYLPPATRTVTSSFAVG